MSSAAPKIVAPDVQLCETQFGDPNYLEPIVVGHPHVKSRSNSIINFSSVPDIIISKELSDGDEWDHGNQSWDVEFEGKRGYGNIRYIEEVLLFTII